MPEDAIADEWGDEVLDGLREKGIEPAVFARAFDAVVTNRAMTLEALASLVGLEPAETRPVVEALMDYEDVYLSIAENGTGKPQFWYCHASGILAALCRRRKISLARFIQSMPEMESFMNSAENYYVRRMADDRSGVIKLSRLKKELAKHLRQVLGPTHPYVIGRYVRTAQDLVLLKLDFPRRFLDDLQQEAGFERLGDGKAKWSSRRATWRRTWRITRGGKYAERGGRRV